MTLLWLATVMVPSTALAWNLLRDGRPLTDAAPSVAPVRPTRAGPVGDFEAGGRVYRAVEAALPAGGRRG